MFATGCESSGVQTLVACEGRDRLHASCPAGQVINVIDGFYGRAVPDTELCPFGGAQNDDVTCRSASSSAVVRKVLIFIHEHYWQSSSRKQTRR